MITHIVMWKLREEAEGRGKDENFGIIREKLEALLSVIPELKSIHVYRNINPTDKNSDVVLVTTFDSLEDLNVYATHPEHVKAGEFIASVVSARSAIDYQDHI